LHLLQRTAFNILNENKDKVNSFGRWDDGETSLGSLNSWRSSEGNEIPDATFSRPER
jgi:hypothetical protein